VLRLIDLALAGQHLKAVRPPDRHPTLVTGLLFPIPRLPALLLIGKFPGAADLFKERCCRDCPRRRHVREHALQAVTNGFDGIRLLPGNGVAE